MANPLKIDLPYVNGFEDRHKKKWRYYFRRKGYPRSTLPGEPGSPEFNAAYEAAKGTPRQAPAPTGAAGTIGAMRAEYLSSAEFKSLAVSTQRETKYVLDALCRYTGKKSGAPYADLPAANFTQRHLLRMRDEMGGRPGAANKMLRVVKVFFSFGLLRGYAKTNPATGVKLLKGGRFRAWTDEELTQFEARWPLGTLERTGYALALYTAQRREDLAKLTPAAIAGNDIVLTQGKTGTRMRIPMHPELRKALAAHTKRGKTILVGDRGNPLNPVYFGAIMAAAIEAAGLPTQCVLHGLRKTAARLVAESGGNVGSVTGHLSAKMVQEYSADASQHKMAKSAVVKWGRHKRAK